MSERAVLYRACVGASFAGFAAWQMRQYLPEVLELASRYGFPDQVRSDTWKMDLVLVALFICVSGIVLASLGRPNRREAFAGLSIGGAGAYGVILASSWLDLYTGVKPESATSFAVQWALAGAASGMLGGFLRGGIRRVAAGFAGGTVGGVAVGFASAIVSPQLGPAESLCPMFTGAAIVLAVDFALQISTKVPLALLSSELSVVRHFCDVPTSISIAPGDDYVFGKGPHRGREQFVFLPDEGIASLHARVSSRRSGVRVVPHDENQDAIGVPIEHLAVKRQSRELIPTGRGEGVALEDGDIVEMGGSRFVFSAVSEIGFGRGVAAISISLPAVIFFVALIGPIPVAAAAPLHSWLYWIVLGVGLTFHWAAFKWSPTRWRDRQDFDRLRERALSAVTVPAERLEGRPGRIFG